MARSLILSAVVLVCMTVGFFSATVSGQTYGLQYNLVYTPAYPGSSTVLVNKFTNSGTVAEQVTGITITSDLGTFTASSGLPLSVPVSQTVELNMTEQIPSSASISNHAVSASINFQYQDPSTSQWVTPSTSPLVVQGTITVTTNVGGILAAGLFDAAVIGGIIAAVIVVLVVVVLRRKKSQPPAMGYPAPPPPPSTPPPTQTN